MYVLHYEGNGAVGLPGSSQHELCEKANEEG
ncbi:hypothetical protein AWB65_04349 [Caballeronia humi]|uniref:Uncharacterized protein n=1 Tax=Caballeronia humi TaxID=326474 RepID=A0A158I952_9BURK|nr:hypothetical protein AWB65_04349 [Caballeronia humi]